MQSPEAHGFNWRNRLVIYLQFQISILWIVPSPRMTIFRMSFFSGIENIIPEGGNVSLIVLYLTFHIIRELKTEFRFLSLRKPGTQEQIGVAAPGRCDAMVWSRWIPSTGKGQKAESIAAVGFPFRQKSPIPPGFMGSL